MGEGPAPIPPQKNCLQREGIKAPRLAFSPMCTRMCTEDTASRIARCVAASPPWKGIRWQGERGIVGCTPPVLRKGMLVTLSRPSQRGK